MTSFLERLAEVVRSQPGATAIWESTGSTLSYAQLWAGARRVARSLATAGVRREEVVVLATPRSARWVLGALGCWMAGAAYCPLPPSLPEERRRALARRAAARFALGQALEGADLVARAIDVTVFGSEGTVAAEHEPDGDGVSLDALAYVVFTSGSTGRPKGVLVTHRGIAPMLQAQVETFRVTPDSRCLWALSPAFDASLSDVGVPLLAGATLVIDGEADLRDAPALLDRLGRWQVTHADLPPAFLPHLDPDTAPPSLQTVIVGGEVVDAAAARRWAKRVRLVSVYGPTEVTVCTSMAVCDERWRGGGLGQPIRGITYQIEDGELVIVGEAVARGYLDDEALSAARFGTRHGRRVFRTGDRAEQSSDGWVFLGRLDRQFKVGGQLVAPEEVEAVLASMPGVKRALVSASAGGRGVEAWVEASSAIDLDSLVARARSSLAPHLVPSLIHRVDRLPVNDNGKTDAPSLPAAYRSSEGLRERWLRTLAAPILGVPQSAVRLDVSFTEQGGTSLGALALACRAEAAGIDATVSELLGDRSLNEALSGAGREEARSVAEIARVARHLGRDFDWPGPSAVVSPRPPRPLLLTGASGLLGCHVLFDLLARSEHPVVCLVRAHDEGSARQRLRDAAKRHGLALTEDGRLEVVTGDITLARFGLPIRSWDRLVSRVGGVIHMAGAVSGAARYERLSAINVGGSLEAMRVAVACGGCVTLASTLSIFSSCDAPPPSAGPEDLPGSDVALYGAYDQSKLAAEIAVREAAARMGGAQVQIVRYGLLQGTCGGQWLDRVARGLVALGAVPRSAEMLHFDLTPVEFAARATVDIHGRARAGVTTHHVAGATRLSYDDLVRELELAGATLRRTEARSFLDIVSKRLEAGHAADESSAALALGRALGEPMFGRHRRLDLFEATNVCFRGDDLAGAELVATRLKAVAAAAVATRSRGHVD